MPAAVRTYLTTGLALMGAGLVTASQINPPLHQAQTRVVEAAVSLAAAVGNGQPCSGYNTDGCDISATQTYTPVVLDTNGSPANIAANIINAVASIPRAYVDALNGLAYALEVTGNWWVYTPTNVLGFDPADPPKVTALVDLLIPFKPVSNVLGEHFAWWAKANLPMDAGCTANAGPHCPDADPMFAKMFQVPIWALAAGYQFPEVINPVSDAEGAIGNEIPGSEGDEVAWSGAYVKLDLLDPAYALINYLQAHPESNTPEPLTGGEIAATLDRLGKALVLAFNPFVPMSFLLKGWPYTILTPLFKPFVPILCPTCNPEDPGLPPVAPVESAAATLVSSDGTDSDADAGVDSAGADAVQYHGVKSAATQTGEPAKDKDEDPGAAMTTSDEVAETGEAPAIDETSSEAPATEQDGTEQGADEQGADEQGADEQDGKDLDGLSAAKAEAEPTAPSEPVGKRRGSHRGSRASAAAGAAAADRGTNSAKVRVRAAASGE